MAHVDEVCEKRTRRGFTPYKPGLGTTPQVEYAYCEGEVVRAAHELHAAESKQYDCPECKGRLDLRRTTLKENGGRYNVPAYFAHCRRSSTCAGATGVRLQLLKCGYYLRTYVGHYDFCLESCCGCPDNLGLATQSSFKVEFKKRVVRAGTAYVYDVLISRGDRPVVAVEVRHAHDTAEPRLESGGAQHAIRVVRVSAEEVLGAVPRLEQAKLAGGSVTLANLLEKRDACAACQSSARRLSWNLRAEKLRGLRRTAFSHAQSVQEFNSLQKRNRRREAYTYGDVKCCGCGVWGAWAHEIDNSKWTIIEYNKVQRWYLQRGKPVPRSAAVCDLCKMSCPGCTELFLVEQGVKYGLCLECNGHAMLQPVACDDA